MSETQDIAEKCVGVEVTKTSLIGVCLDGNRQITATRRAEVDFHQPSSKQLIEFIAGLKASFGRFDRVGVAVPGLVAPDGRRVAFSTHIAEHSGLDLAGDIEAATGTRAFIENDANAAGYGEFHLGAGRGAKDLFFVTLGTGVGGSIIFGGKLWRGDAGFAGEFGYIPINSEGVRIEDVASSGNIIRRTRERFHQDHTSSLVDIDENLLTISDIVAAAEAEDDFAKLMLQRTGNYVGVGVAVVINVLNIERIVIGGEVMGGRHIILDSIIAHAKELSFGPSFASTVIAASELGDQAAAAGAALLASEAI